MRQNERGAGRTARAESSAAGLSGRWRPGGAGPRNGPARPWMSGRPGPWHPGGARMGNPLEESMLGISILSALSIAGIHSAVNPSYFTLRSFAAQPEARGAAKEGLWIGLGLSSLASIGIYLVFDELIPALIAEATAVGLFAIGLYAVTSTPLPSIPPIQRQQQPPALPTAPPIPAAAAAAAP